MFMVTKTITVTEEAYKKLASNKMNGESFSELINRSFSKKGDISGFIGAWNDIGEKEASNLHKHIEETRKRAGKQRRKEIMKHLLS